MRHLSSPSIFAFTLSLSQVFAQSWQTTTGVIYSSPSSTKVGIATSSPQGILDVRPSIATSGAGLPIILSAQQGATSNVGGNVLINSGPNGTGSVNGSIVFGTGATIGSNGTFSSGERMRIDPNGRIGIGMTGPSAALYMRRDEGATVGEKNWFLIDRNGANNSTDPAFSIGYRADGSNASRVYIGSGNNFPLDFRTSATNQAMSILNNGNVGVSQTNPSHRFEVNSTNFKNIRLTTTNANSDVAITGVPTASGALVLNSIAGGQSIVFRAGPPDANEYANERMRIDANRTFVTGHLQVNDNGSNPVVGSFGGNDFWSIGMTYSGNDAGSLRIRSGDNSDEPIIFEQAHYGGVVYRRMVIDKDGEVGIGTENPTKLLEVAGDAKINGNLTVASITTGSWSVAPDYVFEKDYQLRTLSEVEDFINTKKHLPEVPSAKEFKKNGINLAEMNMKLLLKVEELTLYTIQQHKAIAEQNKLLEKQSQRLAKLEALLPK